jgi:hypothetical protein
MRYVNGSSCERVEAAERGLDHRTLHSTLHFALALRTPHFAPRTFLRFRWLLQGRPLTRSDRWDSAAISSEDGQSQHNQ